MTMISKQWTAALAGLALVFVPVFGAYADCRNQINLTGTNAGAAIGAEGNSEIRQEQGRERFKVQITANVADGTAFNAFANGQFAGTLHTVLGFAELQFDSEDGSLPPALRPVCNISTVEVKDQNGTLILSGIF
jgi:hypothetical protein